MLKVVVLATRVSLSLAVKGRVVVQLFTRVEVSKNCQHHGFIYYFKKFYDVIIGSASQASSTR
jgi:hypothetical protein